jgi:hypothetical protein
MVWYQVLLGANLTFEGVQFFHDFFGPAVFGSASRVLPDIFMFWPTRYYDTSPKPKTIVYINGLIEYPVEISQ